MARSQTFGRDNITTVLKNLRSAGRYAPFLVLAVLVGLNCFQHSPGPVFHGASPTAFTAARGWPVAAVAQANDEGVGEIDASIVQGDTHYLRDVFEGAYPHLAWNWVFLAFDLALACSLLAIVWVLARRFFGGSSPDRFATAKPGNAEQADAPKS